MTRVFSILFLAALSGCASIPSQTPDDPYPGSGGVFLGTPSQKDIDSGKIDFTTERFASFKIGVTTKTEVVNALGEPAGWRTKPNGTSQLEYDYVDAPSALGMRQVIYTFFTFDSAKLLSRVTYPGYDSDKAK